MEDVGTSHWNPMRRARSIVIFRESGHPITVFLVNIALGFIHVQLSVYMYTVDIYAVNVV